MSEQEDSHSALPHHVALILDGNRRWAHQRGYPVVEGHRQGALKMRKIIKHLWKKGVHTVTIWVFSTENWQREGSQVMGLMKLFLEFAQVYFDEAISEEARIIHLGRKDRINSELLAKITEYEEKTKHFENKTLNIALDYGGRDDIIRAVQAVQRIHADSPDSPAELDEGTFAAFLDTHSQKYPNPDMVIRTGGEKRMSGFMAWQAAYAEYFFTDTLLPDLDFDEIDSMLNEYGERQRRYGK